MLHLLVILIHASSESAGVGALFLGEGGGLLHVIIGWAMDLFLEDGVGVDGFEFGLEITESLGAGVGPTTTVGEVVPVVLSFFALATPIPVSMECRRSRGEGVSYQLPLPPPCFLILLGSASTWPCLAK